MDNAKLLGSFANFWRGWSPEVTFFSDGRGAPQKWMVYNGKPYDVIMIWGGGFGPPLFLETPINSKLNM